MINNIGFMLTTTGLNLSSMIYSYFKNNELHDKLNKEQTEIKSKICTNNNNKHSIRFNLEPINNNLFFLYKNKSIPLMHLGPLNPYVIPTYTQNKDILVPISENEIAFIFNRNKLEELEKTNNINICFTNNNKYKDDSLTSLMNIKTPKLV